MLWQRRTEVDDRADGPRPQRVEHGGDLWPFTSAPTGPMPSGVRDLESVNDDGTNNFILDFQRKDRRPPGEAMK